MSTEQEVERTRRSSPRSRRLPLSNLQIVLIALIVIGGRLVIDFSQRIIEGQEKMLEQHRLEAEIAALEEEQRQLEALKTYYNSPAFVDAWAHNEGKMVRPGEVIIIPVYDAPTDQPEPVLVTEQPDENIPPWKVWWSLFFSSSPPAILDPQS